MEFVYGGLAYSLVAFIVVVVGGFVGAYQENAIWTAVVWPIGIPVYVTDKAFKYAKRLGQDYRNRRAIKYTDYR